MAEAILFEPEYKAFAVSKNKEPYKSFLETMYEIEALASFPLPDKKLHQSLMRTLFATVITAMETIFIRYVYKPSFGKRTTVEAVRRN